VQTVLCEIALVETLSVLITMSDFRIISLYFAHISIPHIWRRGGSVVPLHLIHRRRKNVISGVADKTVFPNSFYFYPRRRKLKDMEMKTFP